MQLNHLIGFSDEMRSIGMEPSTSLISQSLEFPSEPVANALELDGTQKVYIISRLRCADAVPMAVETVCLPFARFAGIETYDMSKSLYTLLDSVTGCEPAKAIQSIQSGLAKAKEAKQLQIKAVLHAVGVDGVHDQLACAVFDALLQPVQRVDACVLAPALGEQHEFAVHTLNIGGEHHALVAVFCAAADDAGVADGPELTLTLSAPHFSTRSKSSSVLMPPPTVSGIKIWLATRRKISVNSPRPSTLAVIS
mgnify:CR=1 FL=1